MNRLLLFSLFSLSLFLSYSFQPAFAQPIVATWTVTTDKSSYEAGQPVKVRFNAAIETGWHLYALDSPDPPTKSLKIKFTNQPAFLSGGTLTQTGTHKAFDNNFQTEVVYFEGSVKVVAAFTLGADAPVGATKLEGTILYMTCNDRMCLPPKTIPYSVNINVVEKKKVEAPLAPTPAIDDTKKDETATKDTVLTPKPVMPIQTSWKSSVLNSSVAPNGMVQAQFVATISPNGSLTASFAPKPKIQLSDSSFFKVESPVRVSENQIDAIIRVAGNAPEGDQKLAGTLSYTVCPANATSLAECTKKAEPFDLSVHVAKAGVAAVTNSSNSTTATSALNKAKSDGLWGFLLLAMGAALIALLTPCVFPMIPLTVSYFTKHAENPTKMALVYGAAIIATFTGLGLLTALISGAAGAQTIAANPWVNIFIGLVFIVFAFSLLGYFTLELPNSWVNYFNQQGNSRSGYMGVLFMGFTLTLVSFTCTVPFVGGLLAATTQGEWFYPILGMLAFSTTFALPFVLFAMFPKWMTSLPKSGSWMQTVKVTLGFVELAAALKFLSNADLVWGTQWLSRSLAIVICVVIFAFTAVYLFGKLRLPHDTEPAKLKTPRLAFGCIAVLLSLFFASGINGRSLGILDAYLPPMLLNSGTNSANKLGVSSDEPMWMANQGTPENVVRQDAFKKAKELKKPVFIDFTGYTCTNCRQMEANVFPEKAVSDRFKKDFVLLRLFTDDEKEGAVLQEYQLGLTGTVALPTYAIVTPKGKLVGQHSGLAATDDFVRFLDEGKTASVAP
jgi:thiol:disulfide interchange protein DsbD